MTTRIARLLLLAALAFQHSLVVFNNLTDFGSNYEFVRHVLIMDSIFPGSHSQWRAIHSPSVHVAFYLGIIAWELAATILLWWGSARLLRALRAPAALFNAAKRWGILALTVSVLLWLTAFLSVGGEWFLMWQSHLWNGQEAAFRMAAIDCLVLVLLIQPETEPQA